MRSRGMVGLVAFGLATVATFSIFLYVHEVKQRAVTGGAQATVVVSKKDIPTGTSFDTLIAQGAFTTETIPRKTEVQGAVTSLEQLKGRRTSVPILAGEQIPMARLQGSTALPGGAFGIPTGYEAMTLQLDSAPSFRGTFKRSGWPTSPCRASRAGTVRLSRWTRDQTSRRPRSTTPRTARS